MAYITNRALGPRILYLKGSGGAPVARTLQRGETASDVEIFDPEDRVTKAWIDASEIVVSDAAPGDPAAKQPSQTELMAAWREKQERDAAATALAASTQQQDGQPNGPGGDAQMDGGDLKAMSDDQLRAYLTKNDVKVDGRWSRDRLFSEAEKVKG